MNSIKKYNRPMNNSKNMLNSKKTSFLNAHLGSFSRWTSDETFWVLSPMSYSEDGGPSLGLLACVMEGRILVFC